MQAINCLSGVVLLFLVTTSCAKPNLNNNPGGNAPRKAVPGQLVGEWSYTNVSTSMITYADGHTVPGWSESTVYHINADGTGLRVKRSANAGPVSENSRRVEDAGTFEIDLAADNTMLFRFYPVSGKVFDNNVFAHYVEPANLYPHSFDKSLCTTGATGNRKFFKTEELTWYKTR